MAISKRRKRKFPKRKSNSEYKSGFEEATAKDLEARNIPFIYEPFKIPYTIPATNHKYTPDRVLPNLIIVEEKGYFDPSMRKKHLAIQASHPDLDIRFCFQNANTKTSKKAKMTYASWCDQKGFKYSHKTIPDDWVAEKPDMKVRAALKNIGVDVNEIIKRTHKENPDSSEA